MRKRNAIIIASLHYTKNRVAIITILTIHYEHSMSTMNLKKKKCSFTGKAFPFIYLTAHVRFVILYTSKYVDESRFVRGEGKRIFRGL